VNFIVLFWNSGQGHANEGQVTSTLNLNNLQQRDTRRERPYCFGGGATTDKVLLEAMAE